MHKKPRSVCIIKGDLFWILGPYMQPSAIPPSFPSSGAPLEDACCLFVPHAVDGPCCWWGWSCCYWGWWWWSWSWAGVERRGGHGISVRGATVNSQPEVSPPIPPHLDPRVFVTGAKNGRKCVDQSSASSWYKSLTRFKRDILFSIWIKLWMKPTCSALILTCPSDLHISSILTHIVFPGIPIT